MNVLVCGGTGYIGSHICVELLDAGYEVTVIDDFSNSKPEVLEHIKEITGKEVKFYEFNILNEEKTEAVFKENKIEISSCDLERLKTYIRIPTESNRVAFVNILEKYIFTYNINVNDFNISQYLLVESSNEFQQNANIFLSDYLER